MKNHTIVYVEYIGTSDALAAAQSLNRELHRIGGKDTGVLCRLSKPEKPICLVRGSKIWLTSNRPDIGEQKLLELAKQFGFAQTETEQVVLSPASTLPSSQALHPAFT